MPPAVGFHSVIRFVRPISEVIRCSYHRDEGREEGVQRARPLYSGLVFTTPEEIFTLTNQQIMFSVRTMPEKFKIKTRQSPAILDVL